MAPGTRSTTKDTGPYLKVPASREGVAAQRSWRDYIPGMPWERRWVPPEPPHGAPPWLPLAPLPGYWTDVYVPTPEERAAANRRDAAARRGEQERRKLAEAANAQLAMASTLADVRRVLAAHDPRLFTEATSRSAWGIVMASGEVPPTHDLVRWRARPREFESWFRWLPSIVVREQDREPLWQGEDEAWITAAGLKYRVVENPYHREWPFGLGIASPVVLPHGAPFAPGRRRPADRARPEYFLPDGQPAEPRGTNPAFTNVDGCDLRALLSR